MRAALGHVYTVSRHLQDQWRPPPLPECVPWLAMAHDPILGDVPLSGRLHEVKDARSIVVMVHGLGGSCDSGYLRRLAAVATRQGHSVLRLNLRGADRSGVDIYHAGLTADLVAALESPEVMRYPLRAVVGFSLGGHVSLRYAGEHLPDLAAVVAICAPLDLAAGARHIDAWRRQVYCRQLLRGIREIYAEASGSISTLVGATIDDVSGIRSIREWDDRVVARRFGFRGADDYYERATAIPLLDSIRTPMLMVRGNQDPMISDEVAALHRVRGADIWRVDGGHVAFPRAADIERRVIDWLDDKLAR